MNLRIRVLAAAILLAVGTRTTAVGQSEPPTDWIEPETGHRVVRLSREPNSQSPYFHDYPYSADGKKLVFTTPRGIFAVNLHAREIEPIVEGRVRMLVTGRKTGDVYFVRRNRDRDTDRGADAQRRDDGSPGDGRRQRRPGFDFGRGGDVYAANLDTHEERRVAELPTEFGGGNVAVNADEKIGRAHV